jgi:zinc transporter ZupT
MKTEINKKSSMLFKFVEGGRLFAAGGLLSIAVVNVFAQLADRPLGESVEATALWLGGALVVAVGKTIHLI